MPDEWVDFRVIKGAVDMQMVLDHYGINGLTKSGEELRGPCPIHKGSERSKTFTVNLRKNAFKCFSKGCVSGNVLDFVAATERCSVRDAALKLQEWFKIGESEPSSMDQEHDASAAGEISRGIYSYRDGALFEVITTATNYESRQAVAVYRELFGDYRVWAAPTQYFSGSESLFTLVKEL